jgi:predicted phage baseplate assembly protein
MVSGAGGNTLCLDRIYKEIVEGSWIVVTSPSYAEVYEVKKVAEDASVGFALSGKSTRLTIEGENLIEKFDDGAESVRKIVVHGESELLEQVERPIDTRLAGNVIDLAALPEGLEAGRLLAVSGSDENGDEVVEVVELFAADAESKTLILKADLEYSYERDTVHINANVARATHGEARTETLGSGNGAIAFQSFQLSNRPLTHVSAANPSGHESTLEVRVDGVRWAEESTLYGQDAAATVFETRLEDDGTTTVRFGDGKAGARLPTGSENVTASYRVGSGLDGHVAAKQIKLLVNKPLGVKTVENPLAPSGGDEPESLDDARVNAPLTVLTLDRVVSLRDVESFARAYPGIGKARVERLWSGESRFAHVTVAGVEGCEVGDETLQNLRDALLGAWHGAEPIDIAVCEEVRFSVVAKLIVDEAYVAEDVQEAAEQALLAAFSFASRSIGQGVTGGAIMAVLQGVDGVVGVDLDKLDGKDALDNPRILARTARYVGREVQAAQLVVVDEDGIDLEVSSQ